MADDNFHDFDEPELANNQPHEKPLRSPHLVAVMRVVVVIGLVGLLLPGLLLTLNTANSTALRSCAAYTAALAPEAVSFSARFELFSAAGTGWNCYAVQFGGSQVLLAAMGIIPGAPRIPQVPIQHS
ncbi:hypothetical protein BH11ACT4_BH11ACT4_25280 [soil metagenome]